MCKEGEDEVVAWQKAHALPLALLVPLDKNDEACMLCAQVDTHMKLLNKISSDQSKARAEAAIIRL